MTYVNDSIKKGIHMKIKRFVTGLLFIFCAALLVLSQLNLLTFKLSFWTVAGTIIFTWGFLDGLIHREIFKGIFSLAFLSMIFAKPLHIESLVPWTILGAAFLLAIGLETIFKSKSHDFIVSPKNGFHWKKEDYPRFSSETSQSSNDRNITIKQSFSDTSRYVHSKVLETVKIEASLGDINLYLDDAQSQNHHVTLRLDSQLSDITVYVPRNWKMTSRLTSPLSSFSVEGTSDADGDTQLELTGKISMCDFKLVYV